MKRKVSNRNSVDEGARKTFAMFTVAEMCEGKMKRDADIGLC